MYPRACALEKPSSIVRCMFCGDAFLHRGRPWLELYASQRQPVIDGCDDHSVVPMLDSAYVFR